MTEQTPKPEPMDLDAVAVSTERAADADLVADFPNPFAVSTIDDTYQQWTRRVWVLDFSYSMNDVIESLNKTRAGQKKIELLQELTTDNLSEKLAKYGENMLLQVFEFGGHVAEFTASTLAGLKDVIKNTGAWHGNTNITLALAAGIEQCEQNPSPVGTHQVLMVTDARDWAASTVDVLYGDRCKAKNIVVDVVWIRSHGEDSGLDCVAALKRLCDMTGGKFVEASTIEDMRRGFIAGANRLCLPAPTGKLEGSN